MLPEIVKAEVGRQAELTQAAAAEATEPEQSGSLEDTQTYAAGGDSIVQTLGHLPRSGQIQIGGESKGANDGKANEKALAEQSK